MTALFSVIQVPLPTGQSRPLDAPIRTINENFRSLANFMNRAVAAGTLVADGSITLAMLSTAAKTLAGDVTGLTTANTVEKIRNKSIPAPAAGDDLKCVVYNHGTTAFIYATRMTDPFTTRGDLVYRGAAVPTRLAVGAANSVVKSDGTDPGWGTISSLLDAVFSSSRGAVLYRGNAAWAALAPGTSGYFLETLGAGADPVWAAPAGGLVSAVTTKGDLWGFDTGDKRVPVGANGFVLTADSAQALGVKWAAAGGSNALLDGSVHTDTVAYTIARGSIAYGNSTPKWDGLVIGAANKALLSNGTDPAWGFLRRLPANKPVIMSIFLGGATVVSNGWAASTMPGGTEADAAETGAGSRLPNKYTQAVNGGVVGRHSSVARFKGEQSPVFYADFKIVTVNTGASSVMSFSCGFDTGMIAANKGVRNQARIEWLQATDTNFRFLLGDGATLNDIDTSVAKDAAWHDVLIYSPDNGVTWKCELDGVQVASSSTNVPTTTTAMISGTGFACTGANASNTPEIRTSYQHVWLLGVP